MLRSLLIVATLYQTIYGSSVWHICMIQVSSYMHLFNSVLRRLSALDQTWINTKNIMDQMSGVFSWIKCLLICVYFMHYCEDWAHLTRPGAAHLFLRIRCLVCFHASSVWLYVFVLFCIVMINHTGQDLTQRQNNLCIKCLAYSYESSVWLYVSTLYGIGMIERIWRDTWSIQKDPDSRLPIM